MSGTGPPDVGDVDPAAGEPDGGRADRREPDVWVVTAAEVRTARLLVAAQFCWA